MTARVLILPMLVAAACAADARMYQWQSTHSGRIELSGTPPSWYRSGLEGPRVLVYEEGRLVDDTAVALSRDKAELLRNSAFDEIERRRHEETVKRLERAARRAAVRREQSEEATAAASGESQQPAASSEAVPEEIPDKLDDTVINRLKAVVQAWDRQLPTGKTPSK